jgi:hypothetical protein
MKEVRRTEKKGQTTGMKKENVDINEIQQKETVQP